MKVTITNPSVRFEDSVTRIFLFFAGFFAMLIVLLVMWAMAERMFGPVSRAEGSRAAMMRGRQQAAEKQRAEAAKQREAERSFRF